jgi:RecB family exonuclease
LRIVGLVDSDWPERTRRSIFYPASLLNQLGWPAETDRRAAARARFNDLLRLPRRSLSISTFTLEADAIVSPSPMLEEVEHSGLIVERHAAAPGADQHQSAAVLHEALAEIPVRHDRIADAGWLTLRESRTPGDDPAFHGFAGAYSPDAHAVSHVERYLDCPFKYFATHVLRIDEERAEESGLTPQERGQFMHEVFERFFKTWHARGHHGITGANLDEALAVFEEIALELLQRLSEVDRALERTYLLGSAAAAGLAERAFSFEIEHGVGVVERLLEYPLEGDFTFEDEDGVRTVRIRAKADRIDLLSDGTLRIIDYKLGRAPKPARALQLPVYGLCAAQHLEGRHDRAWTVSRAGYVAFREKNAFVALGGNSPLASALKDGQRRLLGAVSAIERGEFPPRPDEPFICTRCGYAPVCRKDYVGDE